MCTAKKNSMTSKPFALVWHSSLTEENSKDLERVQKSAVRIMLGDKYTEYNDALMRVDLESLSERREELCLKFAKGCLRNEKTKSMFKINRNKHSMKEARKI